MEPSSSFFLGFSMPGLRIAGDELFTLLRLKPRAGRAHLIDVVNLFYTILTPEGPCVSHLRAPS